VLPCKTIERHLDLMVIDIEELRKDLINDDYGAFFGAGFGGALMESFDIRNATAEELVRIAQRKGIDLTKYEIV